ncbi:unnamed protein product [Haemonchus placei]|uniref:Transthyretin-like family protein n=1 Tax=Haemonchus placei TaxID=6290 RepID=A0A0N4WMG8_HAEPC|nr:unnamed protein product [Haemonchus placei]
MFIRFFQMKWTLLLVAVGMTMAMRDQSIAVRGKLMCGSKPATNVRVKLWEEDSGPDPDDLLDQGYTDGNGEFQLQGGTAELTAIDPIFKVYHDCDDGILVMADSLLDKHAVKRSNFKPGSRKVKFALPKSYITNGKTPKKTFDIGVLNLETIFPKEEREMIVTRKRRGRTYADYMKWIVLLSVVALTMAMRDQSIAVRGRLLCPDPDDLLDQGYTDGNGEFMLQGGTAELTPIDPIFKPGSRKVKFALPKSYITNGKTPKKTFDIGILNLETIFAKEEREMIVSRRRRGGINADYMDPDRSSESSEVISRSRRGGINEEYMDADKARSSEEETNN